MLLWRRFILSVTIASVLAGCASVQSDMNAPPPPFFSPGSSASTQSWHVTVGLPVELPVGRGVEPTVATNGGDDVVIMAASGHTTSTPVDMGGPLWVSHDLGKTFELAFGQTTKTVGCVCDIDLISEGNTFYATTLSNSVFPFFNANLVSSEDGGHTWQMKATAIAKEPPIDRPWIAASPTGRLGSTFMTMGKPTDKLVPKDGQFLYQWSDDGGTSWQGPSAIAPRGGVWLGLRPVFLGKDLAIPLQISNDHGSHMQPAVALSTDDGASFTIHQVAMPYYETAPLSMSGGKTPDGRLLLVWSAPDPSETASLWLTSSADHGVSWSDPVRLGLTGTAVQPMLAVSPDGQLAVAYYGTNATGDLHKLPKDTAWYPRAVILDPNATSSLFQVQASDSPAYVGPFCNRVNCDEDGIFVLREYLGAAWSAKGNLFVAFTDASEANGDSTYKGPVKVVRVDVNRAT
ncbi:MAG: sialidase family protein [Candidatus Thermoplasmatota archaeon]